MADSLRMEAYQQVIKRLVTTETVVVEIGTGAGIQALMAARAGAKHVYAVEPADSIEVAKAVAKENKLDDRISFFREISTKIDLPEKADLVMSDLRGVLPWLWHHIPTIVDARERLLKPSGCLVPQEDTVWAVPIESEEIYEKYAAPWKKHNYGFDYSRAFNMSINSWSRERPARESFLASKAKVATLNYREITEPSMEAELSFEPVRGGKIHGFAVWFDGLYYDDIRLTNAPYKKELAYGSAFFPIASPVDVKKNDSIHLRLKALYANGEYTWVWETDVFTANGDTKASHKQSTLKGKLFSFDKLKKRMASYRPALDESGRVRQDAFNLMAENLSVREISTQLYAKHNSAFRNSTEALELVRDLSEKYG